MSGAVHTAGPWRAAGEHVFSVKGRLTVTRVDYGAEAEREANARLIAAAPELLEALENLANAASATTGFASPMFLRDARAAIAKAKGAA